MTRLDGQSAADAGNTVSIAVNPAQNIRDAIMVFTSIGA
jgi:hypothetical protein